MNDDNKSLTFTLPEVPIMLQSLGRPAEMVQHYWDYFNFKDTAYIHVRISQNKLCRLHGLIEPCAIFPVGQLFNPDYAAGFAGEKCLVILWKFSVDTCLIRISLRNEGAL